MFFKILQLVNLWSSPFNIHFYNIQLIDEKEVTISDTSTAFCSIRIWSSLTGLLVSSLYTFSQICWVFSIVFWSVGNEYVRGYPDQPKNHRINYFERFWYFQLNSRSFYQIIICSWQSLLELLVWSNSE